MAKKKKRRLKKWVKVVLFSMTAVLIAFASLAIWTTIYAQTSVEDTEYRYVYEKPLVRVDEAIRYDMEGGIFWRSNAEGEREPVVNQALVVSEDGENFHEIRTDDNGRLITGWYDGPDGKYYYTKDHGWLLTGSAEIEGQIYTLSSAGRLYDHEWVEEGDGLCWYENGEKMCLDEDTLLFLEGEKGFYYLRAENGYARVQSSEILLADGRRLIYDETGHIVTERGYTENGLYYFPIPESYNTAAETHMVRVSEFYPEKKEESILSVNHRGMHTDAPENSLAAYMLSWQAGYSAVECDIQFTADGIPVLLHNETINAVARNADGSAIANMVHISDLTYEQVLQYDFGLICGEAYRGTKITRLDEFLAWCKAYGIHPYLEMKAETVDTQEEADFLVAMADSYGIRNGVTWISFSWNTLSFLMNRDPGAETGYLISGAGDVNAAVSMVAGVRENGIDAFIDAAFTLSDKLAPLCTAYDIPLEVWTVNSASYVKGMNSCIRAITTDSLHTGQILGY